MLGVKMGRFIMDILSLAVLLQVVVCNGDQEQDQALSGPVICPLRPCLLPADCKLIIPPDPEDPCACPTCALDCSTVLCALPNHCPNPVTPEGQCCPVCPITNPTDSPIDCNLVDCAFPDCSNPVIPEGQCCPICPNPTDSPIDCNLVDCAFPDCPNPMISEGQCCPICPKEPTEPGQSCPIEGQVFTECGTACPPTCAEPSPRFCTLQCVIGCQCPAGTVLDEVANKCVPLEECNCPPDCTRDFCVNNPRARCNIPGPREIPGCFGQCQLTFCPACYFSDDARDLPGNCTDCGGPVTSTSCLKGWSRCIHKADIRENGKPDPSSITQEKFKCYRYPCQLRG